MQKFGIGQGATRVEDKRLTTGQGRYIDDINLEGQARAVFLRSPHAHAKIVAIDTEAALSLPGVLGIYTVADLKADGIGDVPCLAPVKNQDESSCVMPPRPALAAGRVRHVGDAVAMIVAETAMQAQDAAEAVWVEYEALPAVVETDKAMSAGVAQVWEQAPENRCFNWGTGDAAATTEAMNDAAHIVELELINNRVVPTSIETRGAIATVEPETGRLVLHVSCQGVHIMRRILATAIFDVAEADIHVLCDDVGGGFGMKIFVFPEYVSCLLYTSDAADE